MVHGCEAQGGLWSSRDARGAWGALAEPPAAGGAAARRRARACGCSTARPCRMRACLPRSAPEGEGESKCCRIQNREDGRSSLLLRSATRLAVDTLYGFLRGKSFTTSQFHRFSRDTVFGRGFGVVPEPVCMVRDPVFPRRAPRSPRLRIPEARWARSWPHPGRLGPHRSVRRSRGWA